MCIAPVPHFHGEKISMLEMKCIERSGSAIFWQFFVRKTFGKFRYASLVLNFNHPIFEDTPSHFYAYTVISNTTSSYSRTPLLGRMKIDLANVSDSTVCHPFYG